MRDATLKEGNSRFEHLLNISLFFLWHGISLFHQVANRYRVEASDCKHIAGGTREYSRLKIAGEA